MPEIIIKTVGYLAEINNITNIRKQVFQVEQGITKELEFDGLDETATHLLAYLENQAVGTTRIRELEPNIAKIERLSVLPKARNKGIGKKLMLKAIDFVTSNNYDEILIHAQKYLKDFYAELGFKQAGNDFQEANIIHIKMIKSLRFNN